MFPNFDLTTKIVNNCIKVTFFQTNFVLGLVSLMRKTLREADHTVLLKQVLPIQYYVAISWLFSSHLFAVPVSSLKSSVRGSLAPPPHRHWFSGVIIKYNLTPKKQYTGRY